MNANQLEESLNFWPKVQPLQFKMESRILKETRQQKFFSAMLFDRFHDTFQSVSELPVPKKILTTQNCFNFWLNACFFFF